MDKPTVPMALKVLNKAASMGKLSAINNIKWRWQLSQDMCKVLLKRVLIHLDQFFSKNIISSLFLAIDRNPTNMTTSVVILFRQQ